MNKILLFFFTSISLSANDTKWSKIDIYAPVTSIEVRSSILDEPIVFEWGKLINASKYEQLDFLDIIEESYELPENIEDSKALYTNAAWAAMGISPENYDKFKLMRESIKKIAPDLRYMAIFEIIEVNTNENRYKYLIHETSKEMISKRKQTTVTAIFLKYSEGRWLNDVLFNLDDKVLKFLPIQKEKLESIMKKKRAHYIPNESQKMAAF